MARRATNVCYCMAVHFVIRQNLTVVISRSAVRDKTRQVAIAASILRTCSKMVENRTFSEQELKHLPSERDTRMMAYFKRHG
jgi:hypothetical protein